MYILWENRWLRSFLSSACHFCGKTLSSMTFIRATKFGWNLISSVKFWESHYRFFGSDVVRLRWRRDQARRTFMSLILTSCSSRFANYSINTTKRLISINNISPNSVIGHMGFYSIKKSLIIYVFSYFKHICLLFPLNKQ